MDRRIAPSARIEEAIERVLLDGLDEPDRLTELGRLGAQLVLQRAVEDEVAAFLGRARDERTPAAAVSRNGTRPRRIQTAEGEVVIAMPQVRDSLTGSSARSSPTRVGGGGRSPRDPAGRAPKTTASAGTNRVELVQRPARPSSNGTARVQGSPS